MTPKKSKYLWMIAAICFVVALVAAWKIGNRPQPKDPFKLGVPIHTLEFPGGSMLEVYGAGIGEWIDGTLASPPRKLISFNSWGSSSESQWIDEHSLTVESKEQNGKMTGVKLSVSDKDLLLSIRLKSGGGSAIPYNDPKADGFIIELSDNSGNWITGYGPFGAEDDPFLRGVFGFEAWPKTGTQLQFRSSHNGSEPIEFRLPNPNLGKAPEPWVAMTLPHTITTPDWDLTLSGLRETVLPGEGHILIPDYKFTDKVSLAGEKQSVLDLNPENALGALGSESDRRSIPDIGHGLDLGFAMPADEDLFKFRYAIRRKENYPYTTADFTIIAKARVSADGTKIEGFHIHPGFGITSLTYEPVRSHSGAFFGGKQTFKIKLEREYSSAAELKKITAAFGEWSDVRAAVFTPGKPTVIGALDSNDFGSSHSGGSGDFHWGASWYGDLSPGMELHFGIALPVPDEICEIVVSSKDVKPR